MKLVIGAARINQNTVAVYTLNRPGLNVDKPFFRLYSEASRLSWTAELFSIFLRYLTLLERRLYPVAVTKGYVQFEPSGLSGTKYISRFRMNRFGVLLFPAK